MPYPTKILVYRRNHIGDPDPINVVFGINDCMGEKRSCNYDAVIGIGAKTCIDGSKLTGKVTWVGIGPNKDRKPEKEVIERWKAGSKEPHRAEGHPKKYPLVTFKERWLWDEEGKTLMSISGDLHKHFYEENKCPRMAIYSNKDKDPGIYNALLHVIEWARSSDAAERAISKDIKVNGPMRRVCK